MERLPLLIPIVLILTTMVPHVQVGAEQPPAAGEIEVNLYLDGNNALSAQTPDAGDATGQHVDAEYSETIPGFSRSPDWTHVGTWDLIAEDSIDFGGRGTLRFYNWIQQDPDDDFQGDGDLDVSVRFILRHEDTELSNTEISGVTMYTSEPNWFWHDPGQGFSNLSLAAGERLEIEYWVESNADFFWWYGNDTYDSALNWSGNPLNVVPEDPRDGEFFFSITHGFGAGALPVAHVFVDDTAEPDLIEVDDGTLTIFLGSGDHDIKIHVGLEARFLNDSAFHYEVTTSVDADDLGTAPGYEEDEGISSLVWYAAGGAGLLLGFSLLGLFLKMRR